MYNPHVISTNVVEVNVISGPTLEVCGHLYFTRSGLDLPKHPNLEGSDQNQSQYDSPHRHREAVLLPGYSGMLVTRTSAQ